MRLSPIAALVGAALTLTLLPAPAAAAAPAGPAGRRTVATEAVAIVWHDHRVRADADFDLRRAGRRLAAATNVAVAYARCTDCRALAVSFQVVLVRHASPDLALVNRALAVTDRCRRCEALSWAYQWVVVTGTDRALSAAGERRLRRIGWQLEALVRSRPPAAELARRVGHLAARVQWVLATEVRHRPAKRVRVSSARR